MLYSNRQICPALLYDIFLYLINHAWNLFCDLIRQEKMAFHFWQHNVEKYNMYITPAVVDMYMTCIICNITKSVFYIDLVEKDIFPKHFLYFFCTTFKINFFYTAVDKLFDEKISNNLDEAILKTISIKLLFSFVTPTACGSKIINPDKIPRLPWHFKKISTQLHEFYSKLRSKLKHNILN